MDLIKLDSEKIPQSQGIPNYGATCYFNSIIQCILSLTSIHQLLQEKDETKIIEVKHINLAKNNDDLQSQSTNILFRTQLFKNIYNNSIQSNDISYFCRQLLDLVIFHSKSKSNNVKLDWGQQDAHELLELLFDLFPPNIKKLFEHRYIKQIYCPKCKKLTPQKREIETIFILQPILPMENKEVMPLNDFIIKQDEEINDYICPNIQCKSKCKKIRMSILSMVPEILVFVIKKYLSSSNIAFPLRLTFLAKGGRKNLVYQLVAQSEHSGNMDGGHYWAICLRKENKNLKFKNLNDSSISNDMAGPTQNSYMMFYHYIGTEDIKR
jgi:ubiquitin C-terminal hydrolase